MKRRMLALLTAAVLLCGILTGCGGNPDTGSQSGTSTDSGSETKDTLIVAIPDSPSYMDPQVQASIATFRVTTQMFDRLVSLDNDMNLVPGLAESWDVIGETTTVWPQHRGGRWRRTCFFSPSGLY